MAQTAKISEQVQLKSSGHKIYDFMKNKLEYLLQMFPEIYKSYKVLEGNGFTHGSVIHLKYDIGHPAEAVEKLSMDDAEKSITIEVLEGDLLRDFEVFTFKIQVLDNGSNGSSVTWSIEFVKAREDVAPPNNYLSIATKVTRGLDSYLSNN